MVSYLYPKNYLVSTQNIITYWNSSHNNNSTYISKYGASLSLSRNCGLLFIAGFWRHFLVCFRRFLRTATNPHLPIVSRTFGRREMSRVMDLAKRFEEATAYTSVNLSSLEINKLYPIFHAKRSTTKYGQTVLLSIRVSETSIVQVFLPKRYGAVISDDDMNKVNSKQSP